MLQIMINMRFIIDYFECVVCDVTVRLIQHIRLRRDARAITHSVVSSHLFFFQRLTINFQKETVFYFKGYYHAHSGTLLRCAYGGVSV